MDYSHYWTYKTLATKQQKLKIVDEIKKIYINLHLKLNFRNKEGIINENEILFDDVNKESTIRGLSNDSFFFDFNRLKEFSYCKTNKEEYYDLMVCIVIISLANNIETFAFSTDGNISDWLPAFKIYEHYIGPINIRFNRFIVDTSQFFDPYKD